MTEAQQLRFVSPDDVKANPENPRLMFRNEEMESLMVSIDAHGIQVPLTVYKEGAGYVLLDGERRWRCAKKLNLKTIPVIVQKKPSELENLVLMYNIHSLREQWDYYTIASKLERVIALYEEEFGNTPNEIKLSELTGLTRGAIRRCGLLMQLPSRFKELLIAELGKPKTDQRLSEDLFIEMEKALKTVVKRVDGYSDRVDEIRDTLLIKFQSGAISAVTDFRQLSKIATAVQGLGVEKKVAKKALDRIFDRNKNVGIKEVYKATVEFEYVEQRATKIAETLNEFLESVADNDRLSELDGDLVEALKNLHSQLTTVLGGTP